MMTVKQFCDKHDACTEGREWAMANCQTMQQAWDTAKPEWVVWIATRPGVLTDRELRLFACWCAWKVWHLPTDERSRNAVEVAERYANGQATDDELAVALAAASDAAWDASDAAWDAAWDSASDAAWDAARAAASDAARAASDAVFNAQAAYLRAHTKPNFDEVTR